MAGRLINLGIRATVEIRRKIQQIARERNTSVQALVVDALEELIARREGGNEWSKALERLPILSQRGKESVYLYAQVRARVPDNHPTITAIDALLCELATRVGEGVIRQRPEQAYAAVDIEDYWSRLEPAFKLGGERKK